MVLVLAASQKASPGLFLVAAGAASFDTVQLMNEERTQHNKSQKDARDAEAQAEYDSSPELRDLLSRAARSPRAGRRR
jgi:hypothetical protein